MAISITQKETAAYQQSVVSRRRANGIRSRILLTAMDLFERQTVARTYIADVMRVENLTRELFYYYFSGKEELVDSVIELYRERCLESVGAAVAESGGGREAGLQAAVNAAMKLFYTEDCSHSAMSRVLDELGLFRDMVNESARYGASCVIGATDDAEYLRKTSVLLLAGIGLAEVSELDREQALGQARRLITHVLANE